MRSKSFAALIAAFIGIGTSVGLAPPASADLIFDQTVDLTSGGPFSDFNEAQQVADDFQLQSGASTITDVHWWGFYGQNTLQTDDFTIRIFADISGAPEIDPLNEFVVGAVNRVDTGVDFFPVTFFHFDVFAYSVDIAPLTLAANTTYWLSIVNDTTLTVDDAWLWSFEATNDVEYAVVRHGDGQGWEHYSGFSAGFQLTNDALAVPEPATWALFAAGLAGLALMNRRRKAKG